MYNYLSILFSFLCIFLYFRPLEGYFEYNSGRALIVIFYKSKNLSGFLPRRPHQKRRPEF
ncbi:hypothetical protein CLOSTHATH_01755 [Hungatella hathewayi DSM 13479]|uniref:Uncharacterized protein n=1 Tax=Hungatella hathewayi DSM 13479 TaxID=566550 RepID=D3ADS6_9FIRM|nr:hypothetical protein CLOSTHATH_01755 [Hungatella hathewayi DSM 13479]